jgi:hypothetical protein
MSSSNRKISLSSTKGLSSPGSLGQVSLSQNSLLKKEERKKQLLGQQKKHETISEELYQHPFRILVRKPPNGRVFISYGLVFAGNGPGVKMMVPELESSQLKSFFNEKVTEAASFPLVDCELYVRVDYEDDTAYKATVEQVPADKKLEQKKDSSYYLIGKISTGSPVQELRSDIFAFKKSSASGGLSSSSSSSSSDGSSDSKPSKSGSESDDGSPKDNSGKGPSSGSGSGSKNNSSSSKPSHSGKNAIFKVGADYFAFCAEEADQFYLKYYHVTIANEPFLVELPATWLACVQHHFVQSFVDYGNGAYQILSDNGAYCFNIEKHPQARKIVVVFAGLAHGSQESMALRTKKQWLANQRHYKKLQAGAVE